MGPAFSVGISNGENVFSSTNGGATVSGDADFKRVNFLGGGEPDLVSDAAACMKPQHPNEYLAVKIQLFHCLWR